MKYLLTDLFLMGISVALLTVFAIIGITGSYVVIESIAWRYWAEISMFSFFLGWSIHSIVGKLK